MKFFLCSHMNNDDIWVRFQVEKLSAEEKLALRNTITLDHFRDGDKLVAVCSHCHFGRIVDPFQLRGRLPRHLRNAPFASREGRPRCTKCRTKGASHFHYAAGEE